MDEIHREHKLEGRLYVSFTFTGKDLIPDDITDRLNIRPNYSFKRGDIKVNSEGEERIRRHGCWSIDSDNYELPSDNLMPHVEWLLGLLEPVNKELQEILEDGNIEGLISCFWIMPGGRINSEVMPNLLARLARLNVKIWFDIYCNH